MTYRLPILEQKSTNDPYQMIDIQTNSNLKYGLEKTSLQASPNKETILPLIREPDDHPSQRKSEVLPQLHKNSPQDVQRRPSTPDNLIFDSPVNKNSLNNNNPHGWRMSVPNAMNLEKETQEQRRSLIVNQNQKQIQPCLQIDQKNTFQHSQCQQRKISNLLPIQFMNNFSNFVPMHNKLSTEIGSLEIKDEFLKEEFKSDSNSLEDETHPPTERINETNTSENNEIMKPMLKINGVLPKKNGFFEKNYQSNNTTMDMTPHFNSNQQQNSRVLKDALKLLENANSSKLNNTNLSTDRDISQIILPAIGSSSVVALSQELSSKDIKPFTPDSRKKFLLKYPSTPMLKVHKRQTSDTPKIVPTINTEFVPLASPGKMNNSLQQPFQDFLSPKSQISKSGYSSQDASEIGSDSESAHSIDTLKGISLSSFTSPAKVYKKSYFNTSFLSEPQRPNEKRSSFVMPEKPETNEEADPQKTVFVKPALKRSATAQTALKFNKSRIKEKSLKRVKIVAVTKEQKRLRRVLWALVYPLFLIEETNNTAKNREQRVIRNIDDKMETYMNQTAQFIKEHCSELLSKLYKENKSMIVASNEEKSFFGWKKLNSDDIEKRAIVLAARVLPIFNTLTEVVAKEGLPSEVKSFLKSISGEDSIMPQNYLYQFELSRLEFNRFGDLRNVTSLRSKMIIGMFFILRVFLYKFLAHPWEVMSGVPHKGHTKRNLKSCTSVIYHLFLEMLTRSLKVVPDKRMFATLKSRLQPKKEQLIGFESVRIDEEVKGDEIITGLYTRKKLRPLFVTQTNLIQELKQALEKLLHSLYHNIHSKTQSP